MEINKVTLSYKIYHIRNLIRDSEGLWDDLDEAIEECEKLAKEVLK